MKRTLNILLSVMCAFAICACGTETGGGEIISHRTESQNEITTEAEVTSNAEQAYAFEYEGVLIIPGEEFDEKALPEPQSKYSVPSCAVEGTDDVYNYGSFEVTVCTTKDKSFVYSIYIIDTEVSTSEGLSIGDQISKADDLYGSNYQTENGGRIYTSGATSLNLMVENDTIVGIEYIYLL